MNVAGANSALGEGSGAPESRFGGLTSAVLLSAAF